MAENLKWAWHFNLFSMTRVNFEKVMALIGCVGSQIKVYRRGPGRATITERSLPTNDIKRKSKQTKALPIYSSVGTPRDQMSRYTEVVTIFSSA